MLESSYPDFHRLIQNFRTYRKKPTKVYNRRKKKKATLMELPSLPDEMLANVLKFTKFETISRLRKINVHIDKVAVRNDLHKAKMQYIGAEKRGLILKYKADDIMDIPPVKVPNSRTLRLQSREIQLLFEIYIKRVRGLECINLEYLKIDEKWLNLLATVKKRHWTSIHFVRCNFGVSVINLTRVVAKFKSVKIEFNAENTYLNENITDEVICFLMPYAYVRFKFTSSVYMRSPTLPLTNVTLKEIQRSSPSKFSVGSHFTNFTVSEVIRTIRFAMSNSDSTASYWILGNVRARSREQMIWAANELRSIEGVEVEEWPDWIIASSMNTVRRYTVWINYAGDE